MKTRLFILAQILAVSTLAAPLGEYYLIGKIKSFDQTSVTIVTPENQTVVVKKSDLAPGTKLETGATVKIPIKDKG